MSNFLTVRRFQSKSVDKGKTPLLVENIPVDPLCAPYLVTSSTGVAWVEVPHPGDVVRAAVREVTPGAIFTELLMAIIKRSEADNWGSVQPYTKEGLQEAVQYLDFYGLNEIEILIPPMSKSKWPKWLLEKSHLHIRPSSWIPKGCLVVIPHDRDYVGMIGHLDGKRVAALVHNASRGIAILKKKGPLKKGEETVSVVDTDKLKKIIADTSSPSVGEHPYGVGFNHNPEKLVDRLKK